MRYSRAFTLIELLVTLAILAIVMAFAAPSFTNLIQSNRAQTISNDLLGALQYARSEAIKRGARVDICRRNGDVCANAADWGNGWLVKVNGTGGAVLRVWESAGAQNTVAGPNQTLTFRPNGLLTLATEKVEFHVASAYCITLTATGRATSAKGTCP